MRVGKRGNDWHFNHFLNPRQTSPGSNMPAYPWLFEKDSRREIPARQDRRPSPSSACHGPP